MSLLLVVMLVLKCRVHKMFNVLEMKLHVMGSVGEKHHHIASRLNIHHSTKGLVESLDLIGG
jgi:hypothetical protein